MRFWIVFLQLAVVFCVGKQTGLVKVLLFYRHGDRTPTIRLPKSKYGNESEWPVGFGQLTNEGKQHQYELGEWFRQRYRTFLPAHYSEKDIFVQSSDYDRTIMSAAANLAGFYPPESAQIWRPTLLWQPIPIHTIPSREDTTIAMDKPCPKYNELRKELMKTERMQKILAETKDMFDLITEKTGFNVTHFGDFENVFNTWEIHEQFHYPLDAWVSAIYPDRMRPYAELRFALDSYTSQMARLKTGPLINEIIEQLERAMEKHMKSEQFPKIHVYSGHDTTIANLLQTMDVFEMHRPPFAATIIIELHLADDTYNVRIFYKNETQPVELFLSNCSQPCPLAEFSDSLKPVRLNAAQFENECEMAFVGLIPRRWTQDTLMMACGAILLLLLIIGGFILCFACKRQRHARKGNTIAPT